MNMLMLNEGMSIEPLEDGALTLRTVCLLLLGEGAETIYKAIPSMSRPRSLAIASKSASFSAASWWIFRAVLIY